MEMERKKFDNHGCMYYVYSYSHIPSVLKPKPPTISDPHLSVKHYIEEMKKRFTTAQIIDDLHEVMGWSYEEIQHRTGLI